MVSLGGQVNLHSVPFGTPVGLTTHYLRGRRFVDCSVFTSRQGEIVGYFSSPEEVDKYIGEMFRQATDHPQVGPKMRAANVVMKVVYQDPDCEMTVRFADPMETIFGPTAMSPTSPCRCRPTSPTGSGGASTTWPWGWPAARARATGRSTRSSRLSPRRSRWFPAT